MGKKKIILFPRKKEKTANILLKFFLWCVYYVLFCFFMNDRKKFSQWQNLLTQWQILKAILMWKQCILKLYFRYYIRNLWGYSGSSVVKNPPASAGDMDPIPGLGRSSGEGNGNPVQYSCLENSMDEELGGLQSMGSQKSQRWLSELTTTTIREPLDLIGPSSVVLKHVCTSESTGELVKP